MMLGKVILTAKDCNDFPQIEELLRTLEFVGIQFFYMISNPILLDKGQLFFLADFLSCL